MSALACISADSHVTEPDDTYVERIDPAFRERAPRLVHDERMGATMLIDGGWYVVPYSLIAGAGKPPGELGFEQGTRFEDLHRGGWDPVARLADQDRDGVAAEVIYPSTGMVLCNHPDLDYKHACFAAYNRWIAEFCDHAPGRLVGLGQAAVRTPDDGIRELEAIRALGLRGVMLPGFPGTDDYDHPSYGGFWSAVVELGLPASFHILTTGNDHLFSEHRRGPTMNNFFSVIRGNQDLVGMLVLSGVFERHPGLRVVCVEADAGWAPHWMYRMDHAYKRHRHWLPAGTLSKVPSEYFREHVYLTFQDDWVAFRMTDMVNVERLMWANDFPHSDATWPWSQEMLAEQTQRLTEHERSRILHDNVADLYGIEVPA
jgi:predicted TIM-barrel fold metal-dependent hydrolase